MSHLDVQLHFVPQPKTYTALINAFSRKIREIVTKHTDAKTMTLDHSACADEIELMLKKVGVTDKIEIVAVGGKEKYIIEVVVNAKHKSEGGPV